jgi:hypothetical protein
VTNIELMAVCEEMLESVEERERTIVHAVQDALAFLDAGAAERAKQILRQVINDHQSRQNYAN